MQSQLYMYDAFVCVFSIYFWFCYFIQIFFNIIFFLFFFIHLYLYVLKIEFYFYRLDKTFTSSTKQKCCCFSICMQIFILCSFFSKTENGIKSKIEMWFSCAKCVCVCVYECVKFNPTDKQTKLKIIIINYFFKVLRRSHKSSSTKYRIRNLLKFYFHVQINLLLFFVAHVFPLFTKTKIIISIFLY